MDVTPQCTHELIAADDDVDDRPVDEVSDGRSRVPVDDSPDLPAESEPPPVEAEEEVGDEETTTPSEHAEPTAMRTVIIRHRESLDNFVRSASELGTGFTNSPPKAANSERDVAAANAPRASVIEPGVWKASQPSGLLMICDKKTADYWGTRGEDIGESSRGPEIGESSGVCRKDSVENAGACELGDDSDEMSGNEAEYYGNWGGKDDPACTSCDGGLCKATSQFCQHLHHHLEIAREFDETPPFDQETGDESPSSSASGSPRGSPRPMGRKRKYTESAMFDCTDCLSKKHHPNSERDKTDGRSCKLLHKERPPPHVQAWLEEMSTWPKAEQNLGLERLLSTICDSHQLRLVRQLIEPHFQRDFISLLPKELALYVLSFLEPRDLVRAAQTCSTWRFLAEDNLLWREKCREAGIKDLSRRRKCNTWKATFMRQHRIEWNWRTQTIRGMQYLRGHDDHVITCLQFANNRIVSGSDDNTLKVWNATTGKCLKTLVGHTGGVWSSQMNDTLIISGSTDRTLKVWDAESGECLHTLYGHTSTVRCMHLHNQNQLMSRVVSGSRDATLRVWDVSSGECLFVLAGHLAAVRCVQYDGKLVVSGAYDYTVKVWNPEREECLHTLQGHTNRVYSLQFDGIYVVSGSLDTSIRVWDVETGALKHTLMGHQSLTSGMELRDNILVSGNADSTVKVWDIVTGQCLQTLSGPNKHQSAVTCLQFNRRFVITSSDDGTVKLWDVRTGDFIRNLVTLYSGGSGGVVWRIRANDTKLVCAVGSRNGTEETKLVVLDFDVDRPS